MIVEVSAHQRTDAVLFPAAVSAGAVLVRDLNSLEIVLESEVDHAGYGVRAIHSRSTAGDHIDAVDQGHRNQVEVDRSIGVGRHQALPVEQHQGALGSESAQVRIGLTAREAGRALHVADLGLTLGAGELWHLAKSGIKRHLARGRDLIRAYRGQRTVGGGAAAGDAAAGHHDLCHLRIRIGSSRRLRSGLRGIIRFGEPRGFRIDLCPRSGA